MNPETVKLLNALEDMCRQDCMGRLVSLDYNGQVAGTFVTDSGAISAYAEGLRRMAEHGRFRIVAEFGRMVVGYWPEHDRQKKPANPEPQVEASA